MSREMRSQTPTNHADWLLILRGLACMVVVFAHSNPPLEILSISQWGWVMVMPGGIAVRLFFCLSGYLMGKGFYLHRYSLNPIGIYSYFCNRACRILPLYWAAFFFPAILITPEIFRIENWNIIFRILTFTYNHTLPFTFNPPLWSLSTEVQFYLLVPLLYYYFRDRVSSFWKTLWVVIAVLSLNFIIRYLAVYFLFNYYQNSASYEQFIKYIYTFMPANIDAFFCGFLVNKLILNLNYASKFNGTTFSRSTKATHIFIKILNFIKNSKFKFNFFKKKYQIGQLGKFSLYFQPGGKGLQILVSIFMIATFALNAWWKSRGNTAVLSFGPSIAVIATCLFIVAFDGGKRYEKYSKNRRLSFKSCRHNLWRYGEVLGVLSFGIYVWHYPLALRFNAQFFPASSSELESFLWRCFVNILTSTVLATISYFAIERPVSNWFRRRL